MDKGEIIIYQSSDGQTELDVRLEGDTVWLSQAQMSSLFQRERSVIGRHISNIYKEGELEKDTSCAKIAHKVVNVGNDAVQNYYTMYYNLDVIISVGYRVKSLRGTQFRIWANRVLKEYLVKGYAINHNAKAEQLEELKRTIAVMSDVLTAKSVTRDEAVGLLRVISDFSYGLDTLDRYDYQLLEVSHTTTEENFRATYENAMEALQTLKREFGASELFAREKDESFRSTMGAIYQTFGGRDLYPSVEEKAANLLYLTVKNHSFSDGNKRIAAFLFLWFMERNGILYRNDGSRRVENNTLVALTLMIAESRVEEKDIMTKVIVNLINNRN
ncbi:MAG: virulence protein RhuM/Fic/DOC family protein [Alistipes sp.]|nr:virulence protein RhuM/Fic/DOC family protein [Alistipes sp.]